MTHSLPDAAAPIYLDHNATTPIAAEVVDAMLPYLRQHFGNPSSSHPYGQAAHAGVERARQQVADLLGCGPQEVLFTSGGTEANNLAIRGVAAAVPERRHLVTSTVEHPATREPCRLLQGTGYALSEAPVDADGTVDLGQAVAALRHDTLLLTVMHANNEVGTLQPLAELSRAAHEVGAWVHTDAAQSLGKVPVRIDELGVDLLSVAGHKLYAPKGVGALYVRNGTPLRPLLLGAGHERGLRPGTENVASIVGLGAACALAQATLDQEAERQRELRDKLQCLLLNAIPGLTISGHGARRLPNTLHVRFPGVLGSAVLRHAPGIAASTGSACHAHGETPSAVLVAMGVPAEEALGAVRLTLGRGTTIGQVEEAAALLCAALRQACNDA